MKLQSSYIINKQGRKIFYDDIRKIGITGLYASGKGTVTKLFESLGAYGIDSDLLARQAVVKGTEGWRQIIEIFGEAVLDNHGEIHRSALAEIVFQDERKLQELNRIIHPIVQSLAEKEIKVELMQNPSRRFVLNIPLLFEAGREKWLDLVIVINTPLEDSIQRGMIRDSLTEKQIISRIRYQIPLNEKLERADYVIDNSQDIENTRKQVYQFWQWIHGQLP